MEIISIIFVVILYLLGALFVNSRSAAIAELADQTDMLSPAVAGIMHSVVEIYLVFGAIMILIWSYIAPRKWVVRSLKSIGLVNKADMSPIPIKRRRDKRDPNITVWTFGANNIPLRIWEDKRDEIETALGVIIVKMKYARGNQDVVIHTVPAGNGLPDLLTWDAKYLSRESFVLTLGEGYAGLVSVNLSDIPHILLGGSTGSGKSVLLKVLLLQALEKGARVTIADFKGGVDFSPMWHSRCQMCHDEQSLLTILDECKKEIEWRKAEFRSAGVPNIDTYNMTNGVNLPRWVIACDEVAEVLDKTGRSKEDKELIGRIESRLSLIARQGRAFGIHLILATQRPDANILSGQIRNNISFRICGRADNVLSQIILDSTAAADQIPKDAKGRFLLQDGTVFQGFWLDEGI